MSSSRDRVPFEMSQAETNNQFDAMFGVVHPIGMVCEAPDNEPSAHVQALDKIDRLARECERWRIRGELIDWLIVDLSPSDAGLINGRRITDEIDRICPKE